MSYYEICPECGGCMYNIDQYGFSGMKCDTCYLIRRPWRWDFIVWKRSHRIDEVTTLVTFLEIKENHKWRSQ